MKHSKTNGVLAKRHRSQSERDNMSIQGVTTMPDSNTQCTQWLRELESEQRRTLFFVQEYLFITVHRRRAGKITSLQLPGKKWYEQGTPMDSKTMRLKVSREQVIAERESKERSAITPQAVAPLSTTKKETSGNCEPRRDTKSRGEAVPWNKKTW